MDENRYHSTDATVLFFLLTLVGVDLSTVPSDKAVCASTVASSLKSPTMQNNSASCTRFGSFTRIIHEASMTRKYNPLTLICYIRSKKISLLPIGHTPKPPVVIVLVQHLDDIAAACGQLIRSISSVVIERDDLEEEQRRRDWICEGKGCMWLSSQLRWILTTCWMGAESVSTWMPEEMWSGRVWWRKRTLF